MTEQVGRRSGASRKRIREPPRDPRALRDALKVKAEELAAAKSTRPAGPAAAEASGISSTATDGRDGSSDQDPGIANSGDNPGVGFVAAIEIGRQELFAIPKAEPAFAGLGGTPVPPDMTLLRQVVTALDAATASKRRHREKAKQEKAKQEVASAELTGKEANKSSPAPVPKQGQDWLRAQELSDRYKLEKGLDENDKVDPLDFVMWLSSFRSSWKASTWRRNRNAALLAIQKHPNDNLGAAMAMLSEDGRREGHRARAVDQRTSDAKGISEKTATRIEYAHYMDIRKCIRMMFRSEAVNWLDDWLVAGISTGLTPNEWPVAQIAEDRSDPGTVRAWLYVFRPGVTHASGADHPVRTLDLCGFRAATLDAVKRMVERARTWALQGKWQQRRSECAQLLYKVCEAQFPTQHYRYSLHSLRHQFVANMKLVMAEAEVCALAGSFDLETEPSHLAKRRVAWNRHHIEDVPRPIEQQVANASRQLTLIKERSNIWSTRPYARAARGENDQ